MSGWIDDCTVLPDANAIIYMMKTRPAMKALEKMGVENRMKVIDDVARELMKREGNTRTWIRTTQSSRWQPLSRSSRRFSG